MKSNSIITAILASVLLLGSCSSVNKISYMQDKEGTDTVINAPEVKPIVLLPGDKLSMTIYSKDPDIMNLLNLSSQAKPLGMATYGQPLTSVYSVSGTGTIDVPLVGNVEVKGLTRAQATEKIKDAILSSGQANDVVINLEYASQKYYVLGEVNKPGYKAVDADVITILDAISVAGDLTIDGQRKAVTVTRNVAGNEESYTMDLTNLSEMVQSPGYFIQTNDVIYVAPNKKRMRDSTASMNSVLSTTFWVSIANLALTVYKLLR
ncbi:MAG: polysaccharide biosynthesis/export family protein [Bacteroidales bacterium]|nr:polysaccharide biosynthesis/export family protein [Bacteroidales bacterium]